MSHFSQAIDAVRAAEARKLAAEGRAPVLKRSRWLLLKRPEKLTGEQRGRLAELVRRNLRTVRVVFTAPTTGRGFPREAGRTQARVLGPVLSATLDGDSTTRLRDAVAAYDREVEHCRQGHALAA